MRNTPFHAFESLVFVVLILVALSVACSQQISTAVPTLEPAATILVAGIQITYQPTATRQWTATVSRVQVNVRNEPDGDAVVGYLGSGDEVVIVRCVADWCKIKEPVDADWEQDYAWIFRGCLSDNPGKLGCTAK